MSINTYLIIYIISVCLSLYKLLKNYTDWWFINNINLFFIVLKARKSKIKALLDSVSFLVHR